MSVRTGFALCVLLALCGLSRISSAQSSQAAAGQATVPGLSLVPGGGQFVTGATPSSGVPPADFANGQSTNEQTVMVLLELRNRAARLNPPRNLQQGIGVKPQIEVIEPARECAHMIVLEAPSADSAMVNKAPTTSRASTPRANGLPVCSEDVRRLVPPVQFNVPQTRPEAPRH
jgi:hypothetical protein